MRSFFAVLAAVLMAGWTAQAEVQPCAVAGNNNDFLGIQTIRLWPGDVPEAKGKTCEDTPTLTVFEPARGMDNGSAVVILPGGAYIHLAGNHEGRQVADWFTARGFRAFVLSYRLASHGYMLPVPLLDARRAVQLVRARATEYQIDPARDCDHRLLGGRPSGCACRYAVCSRQAGRRGPNRARLQQAGLSVLGYPWIGALSAYDPQYLNFCKMMNIMDRCAELRTAYSPDLFVTKGRRTTAPIRPLRNRPVRDGPVGEKERFQGRISMYSQIRPHWGTSSRWVKTTWVAPR